MVHPGNTIDDVANNNGTGGSAFAQAALINTVTLGDYTYFMFYPDRRLGVLNSNGKTKVLNANGDFADDPVDPVDVTMALTPPSIVPVFTVPGITPVLVSTGSLTVDSNLANGPEGQTLVLPTFHVVGPNYSTATNFPRSWTDYLPHGGGIQGSVTTDIGVGGVAAGQNGSVGAGAFFNGFHIPSFGAFGSWGGFGRFLSHKSEFRPDPFAPNNSKPVAVGVFAGGGGGLFLTNARDVGSLSGPFQTYSFNAGWALKGVGVQFSIGTDGTWVANYGGPFPVPTGGGFGVAYSEYTTNTVTTRDPK